MAARPRPKHPVGRSVTPAPVFFLVMAILISFGLDRFCKPGSRGCPRTKVLHLLIMAALFLIAYTLTRRFYFSLLAALSVQLAVAVLNNAKYRLMREPLVFADFAFCAQTLRFPRLYLTYGPN